VGGLLAEALRMALSQPVSTGVTTVIVAAATGVILSTTGQTVAIERDVLSRIDDAGTRTIVVEDTDGSAGLRPEAVERIAGLTGVEWAIGFGLARDVRPAGLAGAPPVPMRGYFGELPPPVRATPWERQPGTALAGIEAVQALRFKTAAGPVEPVAALEERIGVVGWLQADAPLEFLNRALLAAGDPEELMVRVIVLGRSAEEVPALAQAIRSVLDPADPAALAVRTSGTLVEVRAAVAGELGTWGRNVVALVLGAGLVLTALNVFGGVTTRRRDFGRRRALGASRFDIMLLVTAQTVVTAVVGAASGAAVGALVVFELVGTAPQLEFVVAVAVLAILTTASAALPPAALAAFRDPVRILRVP
jgi:putative ABC transport system permease protein